MSWDKGIAFEYAYAKIKKQFQKSKKPTHRVYNAILLIQVRNGCRISEAVDAFIEFVKTKKFEVLTRVAKKKNAEERLIVIPSELRNENFNDCIDIIADRKKLLTRVKVFCLRKYGFNTHSLRYAFITYLLRNGIETPIVAKITKHSKLDMILKYTQEKTAEAVLRAFDEI